MLHEQQHPSNVCTMLMPVWLQCLPICKIPLKNETKLFRHKPNAQSLVPRVPRSRAHLLFAQMAAATNEKSDTTCRLPNCACPTRINIKHFGSANVLGVHKYRQDGGRCGRRTEAEPVRVGAVQNLGPTANPFPQVASTEQWNIITLVSEYQSVRVSMVTVGCSFLMHRGIHLQP